MNWMELLQCDDSNLFDGDRYAAGQKTMIGWYIAWRMGFRIAWHKHWIGRPYFKGVPYWQKYRIARKKPTTPVP